MIDKPDIKTIAVWIPANKKRLLDADLLLEQINNQLFYDLIEELKNLWKTVHGNDEIGNAKREVE